MCVCVCWLCMFENCVIFQRHAHQAETPSGRSVLLPQGITRLAAWGIEGHSVCSLRLFFNLNDKTLFNAVIYLDQDVAKASPASSSAALAASGTARNSIWGTSNGRQFQNWIYSHFAVNFIENGQWLTTGRYPRQADTLNLLGELLKMPRNWWKIDWHSLALCAVTYAPVYLSLLTYLLMRLPIHKYPVIARNLLSNIYC